MLAVRALGHARYGRRSEAPQEVIDRGGDRSQNHYYKGQWRLLLCPNSSNSAFMQRTAARCSLQDSSNDVGDEDGNIFYNPEQRRLVLEGKLKTSLGNLTNSSPTVARDVGRSGTCHWALFKHEKASVEELVDRVGSLFTYNPRVVHSRMKAHCLAQGRSCRLRGFPRRKTGQSPDLACLHGLCVFLGHQVDHRHIRPWCLWIFCDLDAIYEAS